MGFNIGDLSATRLNGSLQKVELRSCNIYRVDDQTFTGLTGLEALVLNDNAITKLPEHFLRGLAELRTFEIESNLLFSIPWNLFQNLEKLARISLKGNLITNISDYTFAGLHELNTVDISSNTLRYFGDKAIDLNSSDYMQLEKISFSSNNLVDFPTFILCLRRLWTINLSFNHISFEGLRKSLSRIASPWLIHQANAHSIFGTNRYKPVTEKFIQLHNNRFEEFDISSFNELERENFVVLLNFFRLELDGNKLLCDCMMYPFYMYLTSMKTNRTRDYSEIGVEEGNIFSISCESPFDLAGLAVTMVNETEFGCEEDVPDCPQNCSCWVRTVDGAIHVNCHKQRKTTLPDTLPINSTILNFSHNKMTVVPSKWPVYMSNLEKIDLRKNGLKELPGDAIFQLCSRCEVLLQGNDLKTLPNEVN